MRMSDWSSDVCSSYLRRGPRHRRIEHEAREAAQEALASKQQLGRKAEGASAEPLDRAFGQAELVREVADAGELLIEKGGMRLADHGIVARRSGQQGDEMIADTAPGPPGIPDPPQGLPPRRDPGEGP